MLRIAMHHCHFWWMLHLLGRPCAVWGLWMPLHDWAMVFLLLLLIIEQEHQIVSSYWMICFQTCLRCLSIWFSTSSSLIGLCD